MKVHIRPAVGLLSLLFLGCSIYTDPARVRRGNAFPDASAGQRHLMVFFDGTANGVKGSPTNVLQLFRRVKAAKDPATLAYYVEGVGNARNRISGILLGHGMERRLDRAYAFLASYYRPGDKIYIFGFSRGAHQARALAGLLAYSGLPQAGRLGRIGRNQIREATKDQLDEDYRDEWGQWQPASPGQPVAPPLLAAVVAERLGRRPKTAMLPVEVAFLGVWDTVPGSLFKRFPVGACKEGEDGKPGDRYKEDSYPPIRVIAHALARDEKRSRFRPLFLCPPLNEKYTQPRERWFPGVHSDVGGGYPVTTEYAGLSTISYDWMVELLDQVYSVEGKVPPEKTCPLANAHDSFKFAGNAFSACEDRTASPWLREDVDPTIGQRREAGIAAQTCKERRANGVTGPRPDPVCGQ